MLDLVHPIGPPDAILHAFDLLELNGTDFRALPLDERKAKLARLLAASTAGANPAAEWQRLARAPRGAAGSHSPFGLCCDARPRRRWSSMTFIECKVELRRTDGRTISTSTSLQVRPVVDQPINVPVDDGPWVKAKITVVKPLDIRNTVFQVTAVEIDR
jgi:hypothetical protein